MRLLAILAAVGSLCGCQAYNDKIEASPEARAAAVEYLRSLPAETPIFVWPNRMQFYQVVGDNLQASMDRYLVNRGNASPFATRITHIAVISTENGTSLKQLLERSKLLPSYQEAVRTTPQTRDGCTAHLFTDRSTWAAVGVVLVSSRKFNSPAEIDACLHAGLDYLNGVPVVGHFFFDLLPNTEARGAILAATRRCSTEDGNPLDPPERSRDGMTPLPLTSCVIGKLSNEQ